MFYVLPIVAILGLIPAFIARSKGYPFLRWWGFGTVLLIVALPVILLLQDRRKTEIVAKMDDRMHK